MTITNNASTLLTAIVNLVPNAQCAVTTTNPGSLTDGSTVILINGLYVIWSNNNIQSCPTESQINGV